MPANGPVGPRLYYFNWN